MAARSNSLRNFLLWFFAGAIAVGICWPLDIRVDAALDATHQHALHNAAWWCSKFGEGWVIAVIGIFFAAIFFAANKPVIAARIFFVVLTSEIAGLISTILRTTLGRTRPTSHFPQGFYGVWHDGHWIFGQYQFSSFPSGHAASAVGVAAAAWLIHRGWGMVAAVYALAVMWSRIALEAHHLSDVVASTFLAIIIAIFLKALLLPSIEFQFGNLNRAWRKK